MSDSDEYTRKRPPAENAELEREVRSRRKFSLAEAVGRQNADLLKGTSPITRKRQAEAELEEFLARDLDDPEGALRRVLLLWVSESESLLESGYEDVGVALAGAIERITGSDALLRRFVRAVDAEWGRIYLERPHFDRPGRASDPDDPYTGESVRQALLSLLDESRGQGEEE